MSVFTMLRQLLPGPWRRARRTSLVPAPLPGLAEVDEMEDTAFEGYLEAIFQRLGHIAERTPHSDRGADLILIEEGVRTAVQARRLKGEVGADAVKAVVTSMRPHGCTKAMIVTNSSYTLPARPRAQDDNVEL